MARPDRRLRPAGFDELGLRRALADRMLPFLVAAMAFLAALAFAGFVGAAGLARHWQHDAGSALTVQVPMPNDPAAGASGQTRLSRVLGLLGGNPAIASAHALTGQELNALLRPWLGEDSAALGLKLPAVIAVRLADPDAVDRPAFGRLGESLRQAAPGTMIEQQGVWVRRLSALARSLQACAGLALIVVAAVASAVVAVATRAGLSARRAAIEIVHGLGATDGFIAWRFAARATLLAAVGGAAGAIAALPVLIELAILAAPFAEGSLGGTAPGLLEAVPAALWLSLPGLPAVTAAIGFLTAQATVRRWLLRLP